MECATFEENQCNTKTGCRWQPGQPPGQQGECANVHQCQEDGLNDAIYVKIPARSAPGGQPPPPARLELAPVSATETESSNVPEMETSNVTTPALAKETAPAPESPPQAIWYVAHEDYDKSDAEQTATKVFFREEDVTEMKEALKEYIDHDYNISEKLEESQKQVQDIPSSDIVIFPEQRRAGFIFPFRKPLRWRIQDYTVGAVFSMFFVLGFVGIILLTASMLSNPVNLRHGLVEGTTLECSDSTYARQLQGKTLEQLNATDAPQTDEQKACMRQAKDQQVLGIKAREAARATAASFICSIVFSSLNSALDATCKINPATSTALVGMMMNGTVGFLLDNAMGQDTAFAIWQEEGVGPAMQYAFAQLDVTSSPKFIRYVVSILFDIFITVILFKPLYGSLIRVPFFRCGETPRAMANGLVSAFIAMITFQAYANNMRLNWAYPSRMIMEAEKEQPGTIINGTTMLIATVIMAMVYLNTETRVNPAAAKEGINDPSCKRGIVFIVLLLVAGLSKFNYLNPSIDEGQGTDDISVRSTRGFWMFCGIVALAIGGTLYTSEKLDRKEKVGAWVVIVVVICAVFFMLKAWTPKVSASDTEERAEKATLAHKRKLPAILLAVSALAIGSPLVARAGQSTVEYWRQLTQAYAKIGARKIAHLTDSKRLMFAGALFLALAISCIATRDKEDNHQPVLGIFTALLLILCMGLFYRVTTK